MQSLFYSVSDLFNAYAPRLIGVFVVLALVALFYTIRWVVRRQDNARRTRSARKTSRWTNLHLLI
jgi:hypothetical protein